MLWFQLYLKYGLGKFVWFPLCTFMFESHMICICICVSGKIKAFKCCGPDSLFSYISVYPCLHYTLLKIRG